MAAHPTAILLQLFQFSFIWKNVYYSNTLLAAGVGLLFLENIFQKIQTFSAETRTTSQVNWAPIELEEYHQPNHLQILKPTKNPTPKY